MSTQPPDPTSTGGFASPAAAQYQTPAAGPAPQAVAGPAQQHQAMPAAPAAPLDAKKARGLLEPYRELVAFALIGAVAIFLLAGLIWMLTGMFNAFLATATVSFSTIVSFETILLPILAVVLATQVAPVTARAKFIVIGALVEYAVAAVIGLVLLLAGLIGDVQRDTVAVGYAFSSLLEHLAGLGLIGLGLFLTVRVYLGGYTAPKPAAPPYGQPGYPYPAGYGYPPQQQYAQQTGYVTGAQPAAQGYAAYGQQQPATTGWAQQTGATPGVIAGAAPGYPAQAPATGAFTAPTYATPAGVPTGAPASGAPTGAPASGAPTSAAPTSGGYATPGYVVPGYTAPDHTTHGYTAPAATAPSFGAPATPPADARPVSAAPASAQPLSSPFAAYTAPAPTPISDEPVSASPADSGPSTPPGGFAAAGWPGGSSTHPSAEIRQDATAGLAPAQPAQPEEEGTAVLSPVQSDEEGTAVLSPADPDATTVLRPAAKADDDDQTQRTQAIPPSN
ncbi:hypothetical protein ABT297_05305 [Dactylosporangium sp. NPDC000555]|uniref:hypothetical protein n=1 Tax=Dactylosporangium sp. NPDC000555 TaxID=3154260 RepID=UPI003326F418